MARIARMIGILCVLALLPGIPALAAEAGTAGQGPGEESAVEFFECVDLSEAGPAVSLLDTVWEDSYTCYGDQLTGDARMIYETLEEAFANDQAPLEEWKSSSGVFYWTVEDVLTESWSREEYEAQKNAWYEKAKNAAIAAAAAFSGDHPEYFWIRTSIAIPYTASFSYGEWKAELSIGFKAQPSCDTVEKRDALEEQLAPVIRGLLEDTEGMPAVARLAYWDNWLAAHNEYNIKAAYTAGYLAQDDTPWSIAGALLEDYSPVCEGYAKAFQLLCHEIGVPCLQISGSTGGGGHMWTAVRLDGSWYLCDPTFDDPIISGGTTRNYSSRNYFLTAQTDGRVVDLALATPVISDSNYFSGWSLTESALTGGEKSTGRLLMALYTQDGQMLACGVCTAFEWSVNDWTGAVSYMYVAPEFDGELLAQAARAVRFRLNDSTLAPLSQTSVILAAEALE